VKLPAVAIAAALSGGIALGLCPPSSTRLGRKWRLISAGDENPCGHPSLRCSKGWTGPESLSTVPIGAAP
jgi:hypothetical protein